MKMTVDPDLCTGCGLCIDECPEVFVMGDMVAEVILNPVTTDLEGSAKDAEDGCPVGAISHM